MVESLVIIVMLTTALIAAWFIHDVSIAKMNAMHDAKNAAWDEAMYGCGPTASLDGNALSSTVDEADTLNEDSSTTHDGSNASSSQGSDVPGLSGGSYHVGSTSQVACNERTSDEPGLGGILEWALSNILDGGFL